MEDAYSGVYLVFLLALLENMLQLNEYLDLNLTSHVWSTVPFFASQDPIYNTITLLIQPTTIFSCP